MIINISYSAKQEFDKITTDFVWKDEYHYSGILL
ncbi:hypothetical protein SDC9_80106 [bioreactor metagenome]|uniref:Uncharacterized protein n=1 Tax=bioreactor metagenome TaxID=1076179 RepID=A0A644YY34_9ZZZZ